MLELHDDLDLLFVEDRAGTVHILDVDDADAAQLHEIADALGRGADEPARHALDEHGIVRDEAVSAFDELHCRLALAHARRARDEDPDAKDVHEDAVHGRRGRQQPRKIGDKVGHDHRRQARRAENGRTRRTRTLHKFGKDGKIAREDDTGDLAAVEQFPDLPLALFGREGTQILVLRKADDEDALGIEVAEKPRKAQSGTVDADAGELDDPPPRIEHFDLEIVRKLVEHHRDGRKKVFVHCCPPSGAAASPFITYRSSAKATPSSSLEGMTKATRFNASTPFLTANFPPAASNMGRSLS